MEVWPTSRNGSLDMRQQEMSMTYHTCILIVQKINFEKWDFHKIAKLDFINETSIGKSMCFCLLVWGQC